MTTDLIVKDGDLLEQSVDVIVNAWNRNLIPWWLLLPQGVSGAIKRRAGYGPFHELSRKGVLPLGGATITGAGRLPFRAIIHVAGIGFLWRASEKSIRKSVRNALLLAAQHGFRSVAFPLIGAGTGGGHPDEVQAIMEDEIRKSGFAGRVLLVRFGRRDHMKRRWKVVVLTCVAVVIGCTMWLASARTPSPYRAKRLALVPAQSQSADGRWADAKSGIIYVWASYDVSACVLPRYSFGYDWVMLVRTPDGKTYDRVMEQRFVFPSHGAVEAVDAHVREESELPDYDRDLFRRSK